jgi:O-antigen/teichoic acid export membrane protein
MRASATDGSSTPGEHADAIISLGRGTSVMVVSTVLLLLFSFIGRVAVARHLTLTDFGDFNLAISFTGFLSLVALLGLHQAIARTLAHESDPGMRRKVIRLGFAVTATAAVVASTSVYLLAPQLAMLFSGGIPANDPDLTLVFRLFSFTLAMTLGTTFLASIFQGFENAGPNAWFNQTAQPAAFVVFVLAFLTLHLTLFTATLAWLLSNVTMFIGIVIYSAIRLPRYLPKAPASTRPIQGLFSLSIALWGVTTMQFVTAYADTLILGVFWPESQVGLYSAAMTLARLILAGNGALTFIFLPVAARLHRQGDVDALRKVFVTSTRWVLVITLPLFLLFSIMPALSLTAVYGASYAPAGAALGLITIGAFFSVLVGPVNSCLAGVGMTRQLLMTTVVSAGTNVVLSFALIPHFDLTGGAISWAISRALYPGSGLLSLWAVHRITPFRRPLLAPVGVALAIGVPAFYGLSLLALPYWTVYPLFFVGVGIFLLALFITRSIEEGDLVAFHHLERVIGRSFPRVARLLEWGLHVPRPLGAVTPLQ